MRRIFHGETGEKSALLDFTSNDAARIRRPAARTAASSGAPEISSKLTNVVVVVVVVEEGAEPTTSGANNDHNHPNNNIHYGLPGTDALCLLTAS